MTAAPDRDRVYAAISDAFYNARNAGRTMTDATNDATDHVLKLLEEARPVPHENRPTLTPAPNRPAVTVAGGIAVAQPSASWPPSPAEDARERDVMQSDDGEDEA